MGIIVDEPRLPLELIEEATGNADLPHHYLTKVVMH